MKKIRFIFAVLFAVGGLASPSLHAQFAYQPISISLIGQYQTNVVGTVTASGVTYTNVQSYVRTVLLTTGNVIHAIAVDEFGAQATNWGDSTLLREVNLSDNTESIVLHNNFNLSLTNHDVSMYFGGFASNFTSDLGNYLGGLTNNFTNAFNSTNNFNFTNRTQLETGRIQTYPTAYTNYNSTWGLYTLSLNTRNLKFNLLAIGSGELTTVGGRSGGTPYSERINSGSFTANGAFYANIATNIFLEAGDTDYYAATNNFAGTNPPVFISGPLRGSFATGAPHFAARTSP